MNICDLKESFGKADPALAVSTPLSTCTLDLAVPNAFLEEGPIFLED
jgi:hypothetical protein